MIPFNDFWQRYPRKIAKKHAQIMWERLTHEQRAKALEVIDAHIKQWALAGRTMEVIPHAGTWLNGERFEDELQTPQQLIYVRDNYIPVPKEGAAMPDNLMQFVRGRK